MLTFTDTLTKMMNFKHVFRHVLLLVLLGMLQTPVWATTPTLLILGDSLSAGYRLTEADSWAYRLNRHWQAILGAPRVINASISGDTAAQGLARLPALLTQHQPQWVLIELGANDGLRGFPVTSLSHDLTQIIELIRAQGAKPLLMQIHIPPNYGKRYSETFSATYSTLAQQFTVPLIPFYMEQVVLHPEWMQDDGLHPNAQAQPFIMQWMSDQLLPLMVSSTQTSQ